MYILCMFIHNIHNSRKRLIPDCAPFNRGVCGLFACSPWRLFSAPDRDDFRLELYLPCVAPMPQGVSSSWGIWRMVLHTLMIK